MWKCITGCSDREFINSISYDKLNCIIQDNKVIGLGATILNGYSTINPFGGLKFLATCEELNGVSSSVFEYIYLSEYNETIGYEDSNISSPERNICDYLMYPKELGADLYLLDALEGYEDEFGNFDKVYEMMDKLNIKRSELDMWIPHMWNQE